MNQIFDKEDMRNAPKGTSWKLTVTNEQTGEVVIEHMNVKGGLFVVQRKDDGLTGTDQSCFGEHMSIALCAVKTPALMREMLKKVGAYDELVGLAKVSGLDTSIV